MIRQKKITIMFIVAALFVTLLTPTMSAAAITVATPTNRELPTT